MEVSRIASTIFAKAYYPEKVVVLKILPKLVVLSICLVIILPFQAKSQASEYDSLLNYYLKSDSIMLDQLEYDLAFDSLDIITLIDSLLNSDFRFSQLSLRLGYTSNITYAGRNFGIEQHGFGIGASYYHKTGLFADASGFWNSDINPNYNPTILTLGYLGNFSRKWTYTLSYDHFFYNTPEETDELVYYPITNSLNASTYYELGKFTLAGDYSFLFGEASAHRFRANLIYTLTKTNWGFIDRFVFMPTASVLMGNSDIYQLTPVYPEKNLSTRREIRQIMFDEYGKNMIEYLWRNNREKYFELEQDIYDQNRNDFTQYEISTDNVFGIMNYSFSAPMYFYFNKLTVSLSYHYNIPVALAGEELNLKPNSYVGATLIYNIPFLKNKKK